MIKKRKINSYDILFLLIVFSIVFVIFINFSTKRNSIEPIDVSITFKISNVDKAVAEAIEKDKSFLIEDKFEASLIDITQSKSENTVLNENGSYTVLKSKKHMDIFLTLTTKCQSTDMGYLLDGLKYAVPNMTLKLSSRYIKTEGKIIDIEEILQ